MNFPLKYSNCFGRACSNYYSILTRLTAQCYSCQINSSLEKNSLDFKTNKNSRYFSSFSKPICANNTTCHSISVNPRHSVLVSLQKRSFSLKESLESAVVIHTSVFKWISESAVVQHTQNFIVYFHDSTHLPWWLSIIITTVVIRCVLTLPLALYQNCVIARLENLKPEMDKIVNDIKYDLNHEVRKRKISEKKAKVQFYVATRSEWTRLVERDNCHPVKAGLLALIQIPLWVILSTAFRNLVFMLPHQDTAAQIKRLELSVGGVAWFPDLTVPDSFVIPIMLGLANLAIIEIHSMMFKGKRSRFHRYSTNFFRGFSLFVVPISASVPSCMSLYWATSSIFGLCQNLIILSPQVRRLFGIPLTASSHPHPYTHLAEQIKNKFRK